MKKGNAEWCQKGDLCSGRYERGPLNSGPLNVGTDSEELYINVASPFKASWKVL